MRPPAQIGPYRIERLLGTGSFATVWLGFEPSLDARVAIKVLAENWSHDLRVRERFLDEARLLWRLDHVRIVRVYSLGELADGRPYLVMAWADGGSLRDRLAAGPMGVGASLALLREVAAGVAVLHDNGVVHRDLTPGNVLFRSATDGVPAPSEQVMIADLGLSKALAAASGLTARAGTPGYMAPEQDDPMSIVDTRTDVFGLGRLGAELLGRTNSGRTDKGRPNGGRTGTRRSGTTFQLREGVPARVGEVLRTATAHRAEDRYHDASAFGAALERAISRPPSRRGQVISLSTAFLMAVAVLATTADSPIGCSGKGHHVATDPTGRLTVTLPPGWCGRGTEWRGRLDSDGRPEPALVVSPAPGRWSSDPAVPGAFVGLSRSIGRESTAAGYIAERRPILCLAESVRTSHRAGIDWVIARYRSCPDGKPVMVDAAGAGPGAAGLVYVQIAPPAGTGPEFVDTLLAGVRVR